MCAMYRWLITFVYACMFFGYLQHAALLVNCLCIHAVHMFIHLYTYSLSMDISFTIWNVYITTVMYIYIYVDKHP